MNEDNLRELQLLELGILKKVVFICNAYGLKYYLAEGTLLGAVRHNGFIPWDDDLDMCMPREDFEKFASIAQKELLECYTCKFCHDTDIWGTMRISNENHKICREMDGKELSLYVSIDIFPLDGFPKGQLRGRLHWMRCLYQFAIFKFAQFEQLNKNKRRGMFPRLVIKFAAHVPFWKLFDKQKGLRRLTNVLKACPYSDSEKAINFYSEYTRKTIAMPKTIMPKNFWGDGKSILFEDEHFLIPSKADKVLRQEYGDYMEFPPIEERKAKHNLILCK